MRSAANTVICIVLLVGVVLVFWSVSAQTRPSLNELLTKAQAEELLTKAQAEELLTKAQAGGAEAQFNLGNMYRIGEGVPKNAVEAVKWFTRAAEQGDTSAQNNLGSMYFQGVGIPKDFVLAYKWINLAAASGTGSGVARRDFIEKQMTPGQIAEAQRLSSAFIPKPEVQP